MRKAILTGFAGMLALGLWACDRPPEVAPAVEHEAIPATAEATAAALEQGPLSIPPRVAADNIDGWIERLEGAEIRHRREILDALHELRGEVGRSPLDTERIGDLLVELGNWTLDVAAGRDEAEFALLGEVLRHQGVRVREGYAGPADLPPAPARPGDPGAAHPPIDP